MKKIISVASFLIIALSFTSCGKSSNGSGSDKSTQAATSKDDQILVKEFEVDLGSAKLPSMTLPIEGDYGTVSLSNTDGKNQVNLELNISDLLNLPSFGDGTLPNGKALPVDTAGAGVLELPIIGINGKVYLAFSGDVVLVGFAISISQLDPILTRFGSYNLFKTVTIAGVPITAGFYTSSTAGQNGVAAFANIAGVIGKLIPSSEALAAFRPLDQGITQSQQDEFEQRMLQVRNSGETLDIVK